MGLFDSDREHPGIIFDNCLTSEAASELTGYNIQHIRRLVCAGKLDAYRVGRSWLIKMSSLEADLNQAVPNGDGHFGPRSSASKSDTSD